MITFTVDDKNYKIRKPNTTERRKARQLYNQEMANCISEKVPIHAQIPIEAEKLGIWTTEHKAELQEMKDDLLDLVTRSEKSKGKAKVELDKKILEMQSKIQTLQSPFFDLYLHTAERYAGAVQDDYLLSVCLVNEDGSQYCKSLDDFYLREDDKVIDEGANKYFGLSSDGEPTVENSG